MVYCFTGDMVLIRPGYLGYFDAFEGDIFRHVQKIRIIAVQQSMTPLSSASFRPFIDRQGYLEIFHSTLTELEGYLVRSFAL